MNGANDAVVDTGDVQAMINEDAVGIQAVDLLSETTDVDAADMLSVVMGTFMQTNSATADGAGAVFNPATNTLDVDPNHYNYLADGESVVLEYQYDVTDGNGSTITQNATVTIEGSNDAPTVSSVNPVTLIEGNTGTADVQTVNIFADLVTVTDLSLIHI